MKVKELYDLFRSEVNDVTPKYLWSDTEVYNYLDDAQKMFCRFTGGLSDATTDEIVNIPLPANQKFIATDPRILKIRTAQLQSTGRFLNLTNIEDYQQGEMSPSDYGTYRNTRLDNTPGIPRDLITGMERLKLRVVPVPQTSDVVNLTVYRLPLQSIKDCATPVELEIDEQHHIHLLKWMKHRAYSKQDAETFDRFKAEQFAKDFTMYCDIAKAERERTEHKYRSIGYGGL